MIFFFRLFLSRQALLFALIQDLFVAAELSFFPRWLAFPLFLYQFAALFLASRLKVRLTPSHLLFLKTPRPFFDSAKELRLFPWLALAVTAFWVIPHRLPLPLIGVGLMLGPFAAYGCRRLDAEAELAAHNGLFYLQWKRWIHPKQKRRGRPVQPIATGQRITWPSLTSPNIVFLFLESFRAKNVGALGASLPASPCFDALAKEGILFSQCSATGVYTFNAAIASLFGVPPPLNTIHLSQYLNKPLTGLPNLLKQKGYRSFWIEGGYTSFCGVHPFLKAHGFDEVVGAEEIKTSSLSWGAHDRDLFAYAARMLKTKREPPFFATLFTLSNHHPWKAPEGWRFETPSHLHPIYRQFLQTYSYTDAALGEFIQSMKQENTLFFITGDHGQREDTITRSDLSQPNIHVPLLIYGEGIKKAQVVTEPCSHVDLFAMVLDLLHIPHSQGFEPSYFSAPGAIPLRGCRSGPWKWVGLANGKEAKLFNLEEDPEESTDAAARFPHIAEELKEKTLSTFEALETLLEKEGALPPELLQVGDVSDLELAPRLNTSFSTIDLSSSAKLTNRSIFTLVERSGPALRYLIMPKSPLICDKALFAVAEQCPNLTVFWADDLPLVTSCGVERVLERCPLKFFSLKGAEDVKILAPQVDQLNLSSLFLGEEIKLEGKVLLSLLRKCPKLVNLQIDLSYVSSEELRLLVDLFTDLQEVRFTNGAHFTPALNQILLKNNRNLTHEI